MASNIAYYQRSERIIEAGRQDRAMYIILEGEVEITLTNGSERIVVAILKKNDFFGEISLFTSKPRSATATALGNIKLLKIDNEEQLKALLLKNPVFAAKMVHMLAQRLAKTDEILIGKISELNRLKQTRNI
ncbi:MAG: cyclic nucleotide-binding protein [Spirochaetae bacterium HGW-Spirochaetae-1]|jgi:CRP-like cAMP-binding protein|nr:MAG: cyclic nucleotide-binding protein [Spirochaetae bacterium HGW-Spirochaetae-1]